MGFNSIARYYDKLARLVFGKSLVRSQRQFLDRIESSSNVLVIGGGTGWWLKEFLLTKPNCKICYVEESEEMLKLAMENTGDDQRVRFLLGTEESLKEKNEFDAVIVFCFLDLFTEVELNLVVKKIKASTKTRTTWLVADFMNTSIWHSIGLVVMYKFFRFTTGLKTQALANWQDILVRNGLIEMEQKLFYSGFIKSAVFKTN